MFKVGDQVRVIPDTYTDISKGFLLYAECWHPSHPETDIHLMLGGLYAVLEVQRSHGAYRYELLKNGVNHRGNASIRLLRKAEDVKLCSFRIGDKVKLSVRNNVIKNELICSYNQGYFFSDSDKEYLVKGVLNEFFIFLDYDLDSPASAPFSWEDFKLI